MKLTKKQLLSLILLLALTALLPAAVFLSQKRQDIRPKASPVVVSNASTLTFAGPGQVKVGEKFSVDVVLDTSHDPDFTIANAVAVVSINPQNNILPTMPISCQKDDTGKPVCLQPYFSPDFCKGGKIINPPQKDDVCGCPSFPTCIMPVDDKQLNVSSDPKPNATIGIGQEGQYYPMPPYYKQSISLVNISPGKIFDNYSYPGSPGIMCGGFAGIKCPDGYFCSYGGNIRMDYPDQSGTCYLINDNNPPPLVGAGGTGSSSAGGSGVSVTGAIVDMSKLPSPNPTVECPPFPGCLPLRSRMPWNICWGDAAKLCPKVPVTEAYCHQFTGPNCPSNCVQSASCPRCMDIGCHATDHGVAACIQDVKQCPDGSWVGRTGPRCEFAPCPGNPPYYGGNQFKISGSKNFAVDEKGYFRGFSGKGVFATLNFVANFTGKVEIKIITGSSIKGYLVTSRPDSSSKPTERLFSGSMPLNIEVVSDQTCTPYPLECLRDDTRCRILDEPIGGWCPPPTPSTCKDKSRGDANCDGKVDGIDFSIWLNSQCYPSLNQVCSDFRADFNRDKKVDDEDYKIWFNNKGT